MLEVRAGIAALGGRRPVHALPAHRAAGTALGSLVGDLGGLVRRPGGEPHVAARRWPSSARRSRTARGSRRRARCSTRRRYALDAVDIPRDPQAGSACAPATWRCGASPTSSASPTTPTHARRPDQRHARRVRRRLRGSRRWRAAEGRPRRLLAGLRGLAGELRHGAGRAGPPHLRPAVPVVGRPRADARPNLIGFARTAPCPPQSTGQSPGGVALPRRGLRARPASPRRGAAGAGPLRGCRGAPLPGGLGGVPPLPLSLFKTRGCGGVPYSPSLPQDWGPGA